MPIPALCAAALLHLGLYQDALAAEVTRSPQDLARIAVHNSLDAPHAFVVCRTTEFVEDGGRWLIVERSLYGEVHVGTRLFVETHDPDGAHPFVGSDAGQRALICLRSTRPSRQTSPMGGAPTLAGIVNPRWVVWMEDNHETVTLWAPQRECSLGSALLQDFEKSLMDELGRLAPVLVLSAEGSGPLALVAGELACPQWIGTKAPFTYADRSLSASYLAHKDLASYASAFGFGGLPDCRLARLDLYGADRQDRIHASLNFLLDQGADVVLQELLRVDLANTSSRPDGAAQNWLEIGPSLEQLCRHFWLMTSLWFDSLVLLQVEVEPAWLGFRKQHRARVVRTLWGPLREGDEVFVRRLSEVISSLELEAESGVVDLLIPVSLSRHASRPEGGQDRAFVDYDSRGFGWFGDDRDGRMRLVGPPHLSHTDPGRGGRWIDSPRFDQEEVLSTFAKLIETTLPALCVSTEWHDFYFQATPVGPLPPVVPGMGTAAFVRDRDLVEEILTLSETPGWSKFPPPTSTPVYTSPYISMMKLLNDKGRTLIFPRGQPLNSHWPDSTVAELRRAFKEHDDEERRLQRNFFGD